MQVLDHNKILLDEAGYKQFLDELEKLKSKSITIATKGNESYKDAVGDSWHDNFDFEQSMRESRTITNRIEKMQEDSNKIKIIRKENIGKDKVNIGDIVKIEIIYDEFDKEEEIIKLTGNYIPDTSEEIKEITLNSPLGKAIYKNKIGSICNYKVNDRVIKVRLLEKMN